MRRQQFRIRGSGTVTSLSSMSSLEQTSELSWTMTFGLSNVSSFSQKTTTQKLSAISPSGPIGMARRLRKCRRPWSRLTSSSPPADALIFRGDSHGATTTVARREGCVWWGGGGIGQRRRLRRTMPSSRRGGDFFVVVVCWGIARDSIFPPTFSTMQLYRGLVTNGSSGFSTKKVEFPPSPI